MNLEDVIEVQTANSKAEVNEMLNEGYRLITVAPGVGETGEPYIIYSLGKFETAVERWVKAEGATD